MNKNCHWVLAAVAFGSLSGCIEAEFSIPVNERVKLLNNGAISFCSSGSKKCSRHVVTFFEKDKYARVSHEKGGFLLITAKKIAKNDYLLKFEHPKNKVSPYHKALAFAHFDKDRTLHIQVPTCNKNLAELTWGISANCSAFNVASLLAYRSGLSKYFKASDQYTNHYVKY